MLGDNKKLLIVDDMELNRAILGEVFHNEYEILEAENGEIALELLEQHRDTIGAMLLDIVMPVMDGLTVLKYMKEQKTIEQVPVILITAENDEATLLHGYDSGVSDIINKPFSPAIVLRRVKNVVELHEHKQHLEELVTQQTERLEQQSEKLRQANKLLEHQAQKLKENSNFIIDALSTIVEFRDGESGSHIRRMRSITGVLMRTLSERFPEYHMPAEQIEMISSAAAMHDIGKIAIPDAVLLKPGRLTPEEFEIMKTHTTRGCELLQSLNYDQNDEYYGYCYEICRHHHERWNGSGYPDRLSGNEIPIWAQVVSIADVYEALISKRVYKEAYTHEQAVRMIVNGECGQFNPALMQCFLEVAGVLKEELSEEDSANAVLCC